MKDKISFEKFCELWDKSINNPIIILNNDSFEFILYQTKVDTDIRICRLNLKKGNFKYLKPNLLENLIITVEDKNRFTMNVSNKDYFDVFNQITFTLYSNLLEEMSSIQVENTLINLFQKYLTLFAKKRKNQLSTVVGLYGELLTLKNLIIQRDSRVILDWNGPDGNRHDFTFNHKSIEVKSSYRNYDVISISNEYQLYIDPPERLFLKVYHFDVKESSNEDSVKKVIKEIIDLCENSEDKLIFISKINETGISFHESFSLNPGLKIDLIDSFNYNVTEDFPKITKISIPTGISHLKYSVQLSSIPEELKINDEKLWKQII